MPKTKILNHEELVGCVQDHQHQGHSIVTTNGCFDVLHVGHLRYLEAARQLGDVLIVLVNSDASIKGLKGPSRPIMSEDERAELLAGLGCVDYVSIFHQDTPIQILERIRPSIHVKGAEYTTATLPESTVLEGMGTELVFIPMVEGKSTTGVIERITALASGAHAAS